MRDELVIALAAALVGCTGEPRVDVSGYRSLVLARAPVAYWPLDEAGGTAALDASGKGLQGTYRNADPGRPGMVTGRGAVTFTNGSIELPDSSVFQLIAGDFTFEAWLKVTGFASNDVGCGNYTYGNDAILAFGDAGELELGMSAPAGLIYVTMHRSTVYSGVYKPGPFPGWLHVAFERAGGAYRFFINGEANATGDISRDPIRLKGKSRKLAHGNSGEQGSPFIGQLQDVAIYPKALTHAELREHFDFYARLKGEGAWYRRLWRSISGR